MAVTIVEMERSYLTAEVFKEILQQNGTSEGGELIRTLSGPPGDVHSKLLWLDIVQQQSGMLW